MAKNVFEISRSNFICISYRPPYHFHLALQTNKHNLIRPLSSARLIVQLQIEDMTAMQIGLTIKFYLNFGVSVFQLFLSQVSELIIFEEF
jgi:hypothetical protein